MEPAEFNSVFNRYMHAGPDTVSIPRIFGPYREDHVLLPIMQFGTPLRIVPVAESELLPLAKKGQVESVRLEINKDSWKVWIEGWVPFDSIAPEQEIKLFVPDEFRSVVRSTQAIRNFRPDLTAETTGADFSMGGFIAVLDGSGDSTVGETLSRAIRVFSKGQNGIRFEAKRAPSNRAVTPPDKDQFMVLPRQGHVDEIRLQDNGSVLDVFGWVTTADKKSADQLAFYLGLSALGIEVSWTNRLDVVQAGDALDLLTGFKVRIRLVEPLKMLPSGAPLCIAAVSNGKLVARAIDHQAMGCR
jgi:hypothetical protein